MSEEDEVLKGGRLMKPGGATELAEIEQGTVEYSAAVFDQMTTAIQICEDRGEIKHIRDQVKALEEYARQALDTKSAATAARVRIRAERKWGELSAKSEKATGTLKQGTELPQSPEGTTAKTLEEMGVSKKQSSTWQKLASIPDDEFEGIINRPGIPTTADTIRMSEGLPKMPDFSEQALWIWGKLNDAERVGVLDMDLVAEIETMTVTMQRDMIRLVPLFRKLLEQVK